MPPTAPQIFRVTEPLVGTTITSALRHWLPGESWNSIRRLLSTRHVQVSGNLCLDAGRRLQKDEVVKILAEAAQAPPKEQDVRIRHLDTHLVVVEKPAGMTTLRHPEERNWPNRRKQLQPTLDELLPRIIAQRDRAPQRKHKTSQNRRPTVPASRAAHTGKRLRAVHRLDRETSGLMVFARTVDAERVLGQQFRSHSLERVYIAVALGNVSATTIETNLIDDRGDGRRGSTTNPKLGKKAITHIRPIERLAGYTVVECRLETGRTHQIRIHLSESGHPLCGDRVYRGKYPGPILADESGAPRVALHAAELGFLHPITGDPLHFSMPLPKELVSLIDRLRKPRKPMNVQPKSVATPPPQREAPQQPSQKRKKKRPKKAD